MAFTLLKGKFTLQRRLLGGLLYIFERRKKQHPTVCYSAQLLRVHAPVLAHCHSRYLSWSLISSLIVLAIYQREFELTGTMILHVLAWLRSPNGDDATSGMCHRVNQYVHAPNRCELPWRSQPARSTSSCSRTSEAHGHPASR